MERVKVLYEVYNHRPYRFRNFLWDCFMTIMTAGLWLIWVFCREMRKR